VGRFNDSTIQRFDGFFEGFDFFGEGLAEVEPAGVGDEPAGCWLMVDG